MTDRGAGEFIYSVKDSRTGHLAHYVTLVDPDVVFKRGLLAETILGHLVDGPDHFDAEHFSPNPRFVEFLHACISRHAADCPGVVSEAKRQKEGHIYLIDARTRTPEGEVPTEDIIGAVGVDHGVVSGYRANPNYRLFTQDGLMSLHPWFRDKLMAEIERLGTG